MKTAIQRVFDMCDIEIRAAEAIEVGPHEYYDAGRKVGIIMGIESLKEELGILFELEVAQMFHAFRIGNKVPTIDQQGTFELWYRHVFGMEPAGFEKNKNDQDESPSQAFTAQLYSREAVAEMLVKYGKAVIKGHELGAIGVLNPEKWMDKNFPPHGGIS